MRTFVAMGLGCGLLCGCSPMSGPDRSIPQAELEVGSGDPYQVIAEGGDYLVSRGFQGLIDSVVAFRLTGFEPDASVRISVRMTLLDIDLGGNVIDEQADVSFTEIEPGLNEMVAGLTLNVSPSVALGERARLLVTVENIDGPPLSATLDQTVVIVEM